MPPKPKYNRKCGCKKHESYTEDATDAIQVHRIDARILKVEAVQRLIDNGDLAKHSTFLCNGCASYAMEHLCIESKRSKRNLEDLIDSLDEFTPEQMSRLSLKLGQRLRQDVYKDSQNSSQRYKDDEFLCAFDLDEWISSRNIVLKHFLQGIAGNWEGDDKQKAIMTIALDQIYYLANNRYISPLGFVKNLLIYFATGSKNACEITSAASPSGSYSTIQNWITEQAKTPLSCQTTSDVVTFFDNNQVLERKWNVKVNFKSRCSVITNILHITPDATQHLQTVDNMSPRHWLHSFEKEQRRNCFKLLEKNVSKTNEVFRTYREQFISSRISLVSGQQRKLGLGFKDFIDDDVIEVKHISASERYTFVPSRHPEEPVSCKMGNPCFENPCSYEALQKVFDHITKETIDGTPRQWTILGCDGLPYTLGNRLVDQLFVCKCGREFEDVEDFQQHRSDFDHVEDSIPECRKYKDLLLLPGLGHYEINMTKALFKLLWPVCLEDLAKLLGFTSPKALSSCLNATDHHKSWQILEIFLYSMADELVLPYCRASLTEGETPSLHGYFCWLKTACNPTYNFMLDVVFTFAFSLHLFRAGVRRNNSSAIQSSKNKFSALFFGLGMPIYMETYIRDSFLRLQCPPSILAYIEENESYSVSGNSCKGEGGDFILETFNRRTKMCVPPGLPDEKKWLNACRNIDRIQKMRKNSLGVLNMPSTEDDYQYAYDISQEINKFSSVIRSQRYTFQRRLTSRNIWHYRVKFWTVI